MSENLPKSLSLESCIYPLERRDTMSFICRTQEKSAIQTESEPYLVRLQMNDSYMAYTNDHGK